MAAWNAHLDSVNAQNQLVTIKVTYFLATDTNRTNPLHSDEFVFVGGTPLAEITQAVKTQGATVRASQDTAAQLQAHVGDTINVP